MKLLSARKEWTLLVILFSLLFLLRLNHLYADSPLHTSFFWFGYLESDEGWKIYDARNRIIFGKWSTQDYTYLQLMRHPVFTMMEFISFKTLGVGIIQARIVPLMCAFLTFLLFYKIVKKEFGKKWGMFFLMFLGIDFVFLINNRTAVHETVSILFLVLTLFFWNKGAKRPVNYFLSGFAAVLACCVKMYCLFIIPVCVISFLWNRQKNIEVGMCSRKTFFIYFLGGILLGVSLWFLAWMLFLDFSFKDVERVTRNLCFSKKLYYTLKEDWIFESSEIFYVLKSLKEISSFLLHKINSCMFNMIKSFSIPVLLMCVYLISSINFRRSKEKIKLSFIRLESFLILWIFCGAFFFFLTMLTGRFRAHYSLTFIPPIYLLACICLKKIVEGKIKIKMWNVRSRYVWVFFMIVTHLLINGYRYLKWSGTPSYFLFNISRELGSFLNKKAVVVGADHLCAENKLILLEWWREGNSDKKRVTHIIKKSRKPIINPPPKCKLLKKYRMDDIHYYIYKKSRTKSVSEQFKYWLDLIELV